MDTTNIHITLDNARNALHEVVRAQGEHYRYATPPGEPRCVNVHNGEAHCLVARMLQHLGVDVVGWCFHHPTNISSSVSRLLDVMAHVTCDRGVREFLTSVQYAQDKARYDADLGQAMRPTWGHVRDGAENKYRELKATYG